MNSSNKERKGIPAKVLWYIPLILIMKCLFRNYDHTKNLIWHEEGRIKDGKLQHLADALAWKHVDDTWEKIKENPRNLRLGLSADGINPHSFLCSNYSCWPVTLVIYNIFLLHGLWKEDSQCWGYWHWDLGNLEMI